ncbi:MAG: hypothetical protein IJ689_02705 [Alphaproteobacteria bacterium]|nr:hypothetical protein [Alphaproteobacteria bacterium]
MSGLCNQVFYNAMDGCWYEIKINSNYNPQQPRDDRGRWTTGKNNQMRYYVDDVFGRAYSKYSHRPEEAIKKLMEEKQGFVPAAIYREEIGDIDFVYGDPDIDTGYGLAHIANKHGKDVLALVPNIIRTGNIDDRHRKFGRLYIISGQYKSIIRLDWNNEERNWLASAFLEEKKKP